MLFDSVCKIRMPKAQTKLNYIKPQQLFTEGKQGECYRQGCVAGVL